MQRKLLILLSSLFLLGCQNNADHEELVRILQKEMRFPKVVELDLFYNDLAFAQRLLRTNLERDGWIAVKQDTKQNDRDVPLVTFTDKSAPYLLPKSEMEKAIGIQKVRIADESLDEIINIQHDEHSNSIVIEYTTVFQNITPFASLTNLEDLQKETRKSKFVFSLGNLELIGN